MTDVTISNTADGGEITIAQGLVTTGPGLDVSVYLSLFGGNGDDSTLADDNLTWWGNRGELPERQYRSQTQYLLDRLPPVPFNLRKIEAAVLRDTQWMLDQKVASEIRVSASIPGLNQVRIVVDIEARGEKSRFEFTENWQASV